MVLQCSEKVSLESMVIPKSIHEVDVGKTEPNNERFTGGESPKRRQKHFCTDSWSCQVRHQVSTTLRAAWILAGSELESFMSSAKA